MGVSFRCRGRFSPPRYRFSSVSVFISYAKEDKAFAAELYEALESRKLEPWMDKPPGVFRPRGLMPGEHWKVRLRSEIERAVRAILVLSKVSISKRGYVQREFRYALEVMDGLPVGDRFVVPLLIDDCKPPELVVGTTSLADLQWTDLKEDGFADFIELLEMDMTR